MFNVLSRGGNNGISRGGVQVESNCEGNGKGVKEREVGGRDVHRVVVFVWGGWGSNEDYFLQCSMVGRVGEV